jgi:AmiR/NasT family two-component response regulator
VRSDDDRRRVAVLQGRLDVDEVIAELQADGRSTSAMLCTCKWLCGPRMTAAAFGIVMAAQKVSEGEAFAILKRVSQNTNGGLRALTDVVVT